MEISQVMNSLGFSGTAWVSVEPSRYEVYISIKAIGYRTTLVNAKLSTLLWFQRYDAQYYL